jgi:hypothetical protein
MVETMPKINWDQITDFEKTDQTENTREIACSAGACDLI